MSRHEMQDVWSLVKHKDGRIHLAIPEMLTELKALQSYSPPGADYPFILMAGERRSYNANQIYRDPAWRKVDPHGAMRMHPDDALRLGMQNGDRALCRSARDSIEVVIEVDDSVRTGMVTLPHGYGMRYKDSAPIGPELNRLTSGSHCDPLSKTPFHKHVPVQIEKVTVAQQTAPD
jgi:anaerobic selenocysteine-containing dehydrogenase